MKTDLSETLKQIARSLHGKPKDMMSKAESQIAAILIESGYGEWKTNKYETTFVRL